MSDRVSDTRRLAWHIAWRSLLFGVIGAIVVGFGSGIILTFVGIIFNIRDAMHALLPWAGAILGLIAQILAFQWVVARAIGRRFGDSELRLVSIGAEGTAP